MSQSQILATIREDAAAFGTNPVTYLLEEAASSRAWGDFETARHALRHAAQFRSLGNGPRLP